MHFPLLISVRFALCGKTFCWLEDRRPASNADPYKVAGVIVNTVKAAVTQGAAAAV